MSETVIIIGTGQAGAQLAASLRSDGFSGSIILIGAEPHVPYQRPPLSKHLLAGDIPLERVYVKPAEFYQQAQIELRLNARVAAIDRAAKTVTLAEGGALGYDRLALATGSRVRKLDVPGADLEKLFYLRTLADMHALAAELQPGKRLIIVGGGYIGLEVASVAVKKGVHVTVLEQAERVMQRVVGKMLSEFYSAVHRQAGVDIHTHAQVSGFAGSGRVQQVLCADGSRFDADCVLIGVGIVPNVELAAAAGLAVDNGIVVDEHAQTSDPAIVAAGDCTNLPCLRYGFRARLESVPNALAQARTAAATLCGQHKPYTEAPWFWSDQYDFKLQMAGFPQGHDQVIVRGDPAQRQFMVCYLQAHELLAVEAVNSPRDFMACRQLIARRTALDPVKLADTHVALKDLAEGKP